MEKGKDTLHVLTASHIECRERVTFLLLLAKSLVRAFPDIDIMHHISFSSAGKLSGDLAAMEIQGSLSRLCAEAPHYKTKIYRHYEKMTQARHLLYITESHPFPDEDIVMFCDDDDLLLSRPEGFDLLLLGQTDAISGFHYVPLMGEEQLQMEDEVFRSAGVTDILDAMAGNPSVEKWMREIDFTGYVCRYRCAFPALVEARKSINTIEARAGSPRLDEMLKKLSAALESLVDTKIMNAIDICNPHRPLTPFVFHRIWRDHGETPWREHVLEGLSHFAQPQDLLLSAQAT